MTSSLPGLRAMALAALALGAAAVPASAATVTGGGFDWSMDNYYDSSANDTLGQRTWLGFVTNRVPVAGPASDGSVSVSGGATIVDPTGAGITEITRDSVRGLGEDYTLGFPATGGTYDEYTGAGSVQLGGTLSFTVHPGFGLLPQTIVNPTLTLDGTHAALSASGQIDRRSYGPEIGPIFDFDLTSSTVTLKADGSRTISALARTTANTTFFGARYLPSRGTETFSLRLKLKADEVRGPQGPKGDKGATGAPGAKTILQTALLRKAPFADRGKRHAIALLSTKGKAVLATGSLRARTIRVKLADGQKKGLRGVYLLRAGSQQAIRVRVL
ncbi:MAG TPA: HtaA domain-containing protein [Conexibacter sp.]|nr:HtaA domain-containing protein [Conexibacter sp.]